jgi:hypothetical protein
MTAPAFRPYEPLGVLKPVAHDIWIVDGPEIRFHVLAMALPFPTRMTVIRLRDSGLFVHSPVAWNDALGRALAALGPVAHVVAPNGLHYSWLAAWKKIYPTARFYGTPDLAQRADIALPLDDTLDDVPAPAWSDEIDQQLFAGTAFSEVDFFHRASRTLILTDLIENFELSRTRAFWLRLLLRLSGATDPHGTAPYDMRRTFRDRDAVRKGVERMIAWQPERIILAHGRWYRANGTAELRRAFAWALR